MESSRTGLCVTGEIPALLARCVRRVLPTTVTRPTLNPLDTLSADAARCGVYRVCARVTHGSDTDGCVRDLVEKTGGASIFER